MEDVTGELVNEVPILSRQDATSSSGFGQEVLKTDYDEKTTGLLVQEVKQLVGHLGGKAVHRSGSNGQVLSVRVDMLSKHKKN